MPATGNAWLLAEVLRKAWGFKGLVVRPMVLLHNEGGLLPPAIANILFGDMAPGAKLPFSWPQSIRQVPIIDSHLNSSHPETGHRCS